MLQGSFEVNLNFSVVLGYCLGHPLQVLIDLSPLIDISDVFFTLSFHFINFAFELGYQGPHLLLVCYFFVQFALKYVFALS